MIGPIKLHLSCSLTLSHKPSAALKAQSWLGTGIRGGRVAQDGKQRRFPPPMEGFPAWGISELRKGRSFSVKWNLKHQKFKISNGYPVKAWLPGTCWLHFMACLNLGLLGWGWLTPQSIMKNKIWGERKGNQHKIVPPLLFRGLAIVEKDIICTLALLG